MICSLTDQQIRSKEGAMEMDEKSNSNSDWELINEKAGESTKRLDVVGGWLYLYETWDMCSDSPAIAATMCFVPATPRYP